MLADKGAAGAVSFSAKPCWPIDTTYYVRASAYIDIRFSFYLLTSLRLNQFDRSTAIPGLNRDDAYDLVVDLPPLPEQHRIVAKLEALFSALDKGVESLKTAQAQLKVYRQAVLKHAFAGKLTAQWRAENKATLETPAQLLARIKQEREARYEQQHTDWKAAVKEWEAGGKSGKRPAKPKKPKDLPPLTEAELAELPRLPDGWGWATIGAVFDVVSGATPKGLERTKGGDIPFYKVSDMNTPGNEIRMDTATICLSESKKTNWDSQLILKVR